MLRLCGAELGLSVELFWDAKINKETKNQMPYPVCREHNTCLYTVSFFIKYSRKATHKNENTGFQRSTRARGGTASSAGEGVCSVPYQMGVSRALRSALTDTVLCHSCAKACVARAHAQAHVFLRILNFPFIIHVHSTNHNTYIESTDLGTHLL